MKIVQKLNLNMFFDFLLQSKHSIILAIQSISLYYLIIYLIIGNCLKRTITFHNSG